MQTISEIIKQQASSTLRQGGMAKVHYKLPYTSAEVANFLAWANKVEVEKRNRLPQRTADIGRILQAVAKWLTDGQTKPGLILQGNVGNGKSTMARSVAMLYKTIREHAQEKYLNDSWKMTKEEQNECERLKATPQWEFITAQDLVVLATHNTPAYENIKATPFLILDDLGIEPAIAKLYGTDIAPIADVLAYRYNAMLPTIITTNLNDNAIEQKYGTRIADRLKEMCDRLVFMGASFR